MSGSLGDSYPNLEGIFFRIAGDRLSDSHADSCPDRLKIAVRITGELLSASLGNCYLDQKGFLSISQWDCCQDCRGILVRIAGELLSESQDSYPDCKGIPVWIAGGLLSASLRDSCPYRWGIILRIAWEFLFGSQGDYCENRWRFAVRIAGCSNHWEIGVGKLGDSYPDCRRIRIPLEIPLGTAKAEQNPSAIRIGIHLRPTQEIFYTVVIAGRFLLDRWLAAGLSLGDFFFESQEDFCGNRWENPVDFVGEFLVISSIKQVFHTSRDVSICKKITNLINIQVQYFV